MDGLSERSGDKPGVLTNSLVSLRPDPNPNPNANPHLAGEQQSVATPGREKMGYR
jgi:hypothetical protein